MTVQLTLSDLWPRPATPGSPAREDTAAAPDAPADRAEGAEPGRDDAPEACAYATLPSPVGEVLVAFSERGVALLAPAEGVAAFARRVAEHTRRPAVEAADAPRWLREAVGGADGTGVDFDLDGLSRFETTVLRATARIPPGEVRPYAWVARSIGQPGAVRAVGVALGRNPVPLLIPCHRVVRTDGSIGGYALGPEHKRTLLAAEGVDLPWLARLARGRVRFVGTPSGRYCFPTCANARTTPLEQQAPFLDAALATARDYRPCDRCRPDLA